jgi:hypothetical protein
MLLTATTPTTDPTVDLTLSSAAERVPRTHEVMCSSSTLLLVSQAGKLVTGRVLVTVQPKNDL